VTPRFPIEGPKRIAVVLLISSMGACAPLLQETDQGLPTSPPGDVVGAVTPGSNAGEESTDSVDPGPDPAVVRPGAPGQPSRSVSPSELGRMAAPLHTDADVRFMQMMIEHHAQAVEMTALVPERTLREDVLLLARRIEASQADEIAWMERWLETRGASAPVAGSHHGDHGHHGHLAGHGDMPGMLSKGELDRLAAARGPEFDGLFLEFMIYHHQGAILMVEELFASEGGGQDGETYGFATHVESDQRIEIDRMRRMLAAGT
jgi:uncharacterized protein (DUF305 family)